LDSFPLIHKLQQLARTEISIIEVSALIQILFLSFLQFWGWYFCKQRTRTKAALSNPFATRHMWRMAIQMWQMALLTNIKNRMFWANNTKINILILNLHIKNVKMVWKHMAQDTRYVNELDILCHICLFKWWCYSYILKLWRTKKYIIRHRWTIRNNIKCGKDWIFSSTCCTYFLSFSFQQ